MYIRTKVYQCVTNHWLSNTTRAIHYAVTVIKFGNIMKYSLENKLNLIVLLPNEITEVIL